MKLDLSNFLVSMFVAGAFAQYPYCNCGNSDIQCSYRRLSSVFFIPCGSISVEKLSMTDNHRWLQ